MILEQWFIYLLTSIILSLSPGPGTINTITTSLNHGYRSAMASITGFQTGLTIHIMLVGVGLGTLFSRSVIAFEVSEWIGVAYLIWLGIQQWRATGVIDLKSLASTQSCRRLFQCTVFMSLTNPKSIVFLATLFPQFIMPQQSQLIQYIMPGVTTIVVDTIVMIGYAILIQRTALWVKEPKQVGALNKIFGSLFMLVGALLAPARHA